MKTLFNQNNREQPRIKAIVVRREPRVPTRKEVAVIQGRWVERVK